MVVVVGMGTAGVVGASRRAAGGTRRAVVADPAVASLPSSAVSLDDPAECRRKV